MWFANSLWFQTPHPQLFFACELIGVPNLSTMHLTLLLELAEAIGGVVLAEKKNSVHHVKSC